MDTNNIKLDELIKTSKPVYLYKDQMFMVTVSVVIIVENGVVMVNAPVIWENVNYHKAYLLGKNVETYKFAGGHIKAGQETIQFSAIRQVKEQTGIHLKKDDLMPVDFRSDPERSNASNVIDIGIVCMLDSITDLKLKEGSKFIPVDFEKKILIEEENVSYDFYMDHNILLERAIDIALLMK